METKELWGAEFSYNQKCFHLDSLERILAMNRRTIKDNLDNDYLVFFIGTSDECSAEINKMQKLLEEKGVLNKIQDEYVD